MEAVTQETLLDALRQALAASPGPEDALTTYEWGERMNLGEQSMRMKIKKLLRAGKMEVVEVRRPDMRGRDQPVPAYRLKA